MTQLNELLQLFRENGDKGVYVYEMNSPRPQGLGISQYGRAILQLRRKGHNIVNVQPGYFKLIEGKTWDQMREDLEKQKYQAVLDRQIAAANRVLSFYAR